MIRRTQAALDDGQFRRDLDEDGRLPISSIHDALAEMNVRRSIAKKLGDYYEGWDSILSRKITEEREGSPDNRIAVPYGRKLINTVTGYMYKPGAVQYSTDNEPYFEQIKDIFWDSGEESKTSRLGKNASIFGVAYELHYAKRYGDSVRPAFAVVPTEELLPVYSNDLEPEMVAAIRRYSEQVPGGGVYDFVQHIDIYYADVMQPFIASGVAGVQSSLKALGDVEHGYGMVPVAVYRNNDEIAGDFEHIIGLIDAYDILMSDSMNEFDRFAWAYLVLKGLSMTADDIDDLKVKRVLEVIESGDAEFLTKQIQVEFIQFMRGWIKEEIHKQTHIPDMADENFAGDQSGIAIRYKLTDLENIASVKEIGFREGLRRRFDLLNAFWRTQGTPIGDTREIDIMFNRNIPANYAEQGQIVNLLRGHVSHKTLLDQVVSFVDDAGAELESLREEQDVYADAFDDEVVDDAGPEDA